LKAVSHVFLTHGFLFYTGEMRNSDYVIRITTKRGRAWSYLKEDNGWTQTAPTGVVRRMTAEQLLSHLLPPLAKDQPHLKVTVEPKIPQPKELP
jgi:hypothetical protein